MKYLRWFGRVVRPYGISLTVMMLCHVLLAVCTVAFVYICKRLVDTAVAVLSGTGANAEFTAWFVALAGVVLLRICLNSFR